MKTKKKYILILLITIISISMIAMAMLVTGESTYYDFEEGKFTWNSLYGSLDYEFPAEANGNHYMKLKYHQYNSSSREYFDVAMPGNSLTNIKKLQVNYDVMYEDFTEERNGEMHIKQRTGSGSDQTTLIARVAQVNGYLQVQGGGNVGFQRIRDLDGNYYQMETNHWYTIKVMVDMEQHIQSIYVYDRDTQSLVAINQELSTISDLTSINMVSFMSSTTLCLDNVSVGDYSCENTYIYGSPFLKKGNKTRYYLLGKGIDDSATALPYGTTTWSIENPRAGISINSSSGNLNTSTSAEPGVVIIKAQRTVGNKTYEAKYAVNITE